MKKFILLLLLIPVIAFATNTIELVVNQVGGYYNYFYATTIDPNDPTTQPLLFTGSIRNTTSEIINYYIKFSITWNETTLLDNGKISAQPLSPNENLLINSQDLITKRTNDGFHAEFSIDDFLAGDFEDIVKETGKFPDGIYTFTIKIFDVNTNLEIAESKEIVIEIENPTAISLISPGLSNNSYIQEIGDHQPNFVWFSNLNNYTIKIYELVGEIPSSEEIELQTPYFIESEIGETSFSYPLNAPVLESGKTYAWQITSGLETPQGYENLIDKSTLYFFRIIDQKSASLKLTALRNFIQQLPAQNKDEILNLLNSGYSPSGSIIFEEEDISYEDLQSITEQIITGKLLIKKIVIE